MRRVGGGGDLVWILGKGQIIHGLLLLPHNKFLDSQAGLLPMGSRLGCLPVSWRAGPTGGRAAIDSIMVQLMRCRACFSRSKDTGSCSHWPTTTRSGPSGSSERLTMDTKWIPLRRCQNGKFGPQRAKELAGFKNWLEKEGEGEELYFCRKSRDPDLKGGTHIILFMCFHFLLRRKTFESNLTYDIPRPFFFSTPRFAVCFFETYIPHMFFWTSCSSAFWLRGFPWRLKYRYLPRSTTCKWSVVLATVPCHIQRCKNVRFPCGVSQVSLAAPYFVSVKTRHNPS